MLTLTRSVTFAALPFICTGCLTLPFGLGQKAETPKPKEEMVFTGGSAGPAPAFDPNGPDAPIYAELETARQLFKAKDFVAAERIFAKLAKKNKNPLPVLEEARFMEAECQVMRNELTKAEGTYKLLIKEHALLPAT